MGFLEALLVGCTQFPQKAGEPLPVVSRKSREGETEGKEWTIFGLVPGVWV